MQLRAVKGLCSSVAWVHFSRVACALLVQLRKKTYQKIDWSEEAQWFLVDLWCQIPSPSITLDSTLNVYGCMLFSCSFQIHGTSENLDADWRSDHGAVLLGCLRFQELAASPPDACFWAGLQGTLPGRATWSKWLAADLKLWKAGQFVTPAQHELTLVCPNRTGTERNAYRNTPFAQKNGAQRRVGFNWPFWQLNHCFRESLGDLSGRDWRAARVSDRQRPVDHFIRHEGQVSRSFK